MIDLKKLEVWFITGSQDLYGESTLLQVAEDSKTIAQANAKIDDKGNFLSDLVNKFCLDNLKLWVNSLKKLWILGGNVDDV